MTRLSLSNAILPTLVLLSTEANAHAGHDHSHWSSPAIHSLLFVAIGAVALTAIWSFRRRRNKTSKTIETQEK
ncbi:hypothetical protein EDC56_0911 [Sinobacterium caligoides]|uniref:Secreted protein with PEP-CTERM sorting signal n=1 Tax=Sinobacterium caligoides TaxID=933926 RepID=A0A3N2DZU0_9GAMM|nr:hypothetical protein [Sinobacterium caligoides]ROS05381.1 hypothetical protein EDC56_0911 [Sinobacterium caligoides]